MKICDFDRQYFLLKFALLYAQNHTKIMSFNSKDPDFYEYKNVTFIQPVITAQRHAKLGFTFFYSLYSLLIGILRIWTLIDNQKGL